MSKLDSFSLHFPLHYSDDILSFANEVAFHKSRYIFVEGRGRNRSKSAHCTYCGHDYELTEKVKHLAYTECPGCKGTHQVRFANMSRKYFFDDAYFTYFEKSVLDPNVLIARGIYATRDYRSDYRSVTTKFTELARYVFEHNLGGKMSRYDLYHGMWYTCDSVYCLSTQSSMTHVPCFESKVSVNEAIENTPFQYLPWDDNWSILKFFSLAAKYPLTVEYLIKSGFKYAVRDKMYGRHTYRSINWRGKTIQQMTKLPRHKLREMKQSGLTFDCEQLKKAQLFHQDGSTIEPQKIRVWSISEIEKAIKYTKLSKLYAYLQKQTRPSNSMQRGNYVCTLSDWLDYIADCKRLGLNTEQVSVLYPKNLYQAHQNTIQQIKYKEDQELDKKIKQLLKTKTFRAMYFEADGYLIRPAVNTKEIIKEGEALCHCVGRYADRHAKGECIILLVRDITRPMNPLVTVEYRNGDIVQARAKSNQEPSDEIKQFLEKFKNKLSKTMKQQKSKAS